MDDVWLELIAKNTQIVNNFVFVKEDDEENEEYSSELSPSQRQYSYTINHGYRRQLPFWDFSFSDTFFSRKFFLVTIRQLSMGML